MKHRNLHEHGSTTDVRSAVRQDYERDSGRVNLWDLLAAGALYWLIRDWPTDRSAAALILLVAFSAGLRTFIDQSNRNWWLHRVNWDEQVRQEMPR